MRFEYLWGGRTIDRRTYEDAGVVGAYARDAALQTAEVATLERLKPELGAMDMLDMGVGAGRTTPFFAPLVRSYVGVDYSHAMIAHCRRAFPEREFREGDVRRLDFPDRSFDLVLFSYNGIDHMDGEDRLAALQCLVRVLRPGGWLVFSSHNTNFIPQTIKVFRPRWESTPWATLRTLKWAIVFELRNPFLRLRMPMVEGRFVDGAHGFRSAGNYYVRPDRQVRTLRALGLDPVSCIGNESSEFVAADETAVAGLASPWVYYLARKPA